MKKTVERKFNIAVIGGAGYVGLITGLGFATLGNKVVGIDIDEVKLKNLNNGISPIYEENIENILKENLKNERIFFTSDYKKGISNADIVFIAVGTPSGNNGQADLSQIIDATKKVSENLKKYAVIAIKSTAPVGTVEIISSILSKTKKEGKNFDIIVNPEFLREGKGFYDFFNPDRVVVGLNSVKPKGIIKELYSPILRISHPYNDNDTYRQDEIPYLETDIKSAQMIKYAANAFLATRISFINEIANICENLGSDIKAVIEGMGYDSRIGKKYLNPGIGFGGPCLIKDINALIKISEEVGYAPNFLQSVLDKNDDQLKLIINKIKRFVGPLLFNKTITVFGLTFKPNTNDVRNSLSLKIIDYLKKEGAIVNAYDPLGMEEAKKIRQDIEYYDSPYEAAEFAFCLVILTDWPEFKKLDYDKIKKKMYKPSIIDGKNLLNGKKMSKKGFRYTGIGIK